MKVKNAFCNAVFWLVIILAIYQTISINSYISNIVNAIMLPLFLLSIVDTVYKVKGKAYQMLLEKRCIHEVEFKEAQVICDFIKDFESEDAQQKKKAWNNKFEQEAINIVFIDSCREKIEQLFKWYIPAYTIVLVYLFLSLIFAQSDKWIIIGKFINLDCITLWTFSLVLFDIVFTERIAKTFIKFVEKSIKNNKIA